MPPTWVSGQVLEVHWLANLAIRGPAELHLDSNGLSEISVAVGRRAEHDGHLPVDIGLGESALSLPGVLEETHLNVLCGRAENGKFRYYIRYYSAETPHFKEESKLDIDHTAVKFKATTGIMFKMSCCENGDMTLNWKDQQLYHLVMVHRLFSH